MDLRPLGTSGLRVSPVGFGAFKIGRNEGIKYPSGYALPDEAAAARLLHAVLDLGISYIDTAPAYGLSEERIGRALAARRREFVLSTKVGETFENGRSAYDFSAAAVRASVERSLARLRTDALDVVFVHAHGDDERILRETDVAATLCALRAAGKLRCAGFSGKTPQAARLALEWADVLMVEYHLEDRSHDEVMRAAAARGVGVVVKKGLASGRLAPRDAVPFVLAHPAVSSLLVGGLSAAHLAENVRLAAGAQPAARNE